MLPIIITTPIVAPAESGSFSLMLMSRAPGTLQQGPDLSIDAHPLSPASLRRSGHLEKLGDTTQPSLPQLPPAEPSTTITRRGSLVLTASRTQVGSLARRPSLVPSIMSQKWRNSSTLRRTVQVSMPSPSVILQLCLETFFLDLVVRIFSGLYFFMYILPITQYQWMLDWNPTVAFAYRPSPDSIDPVSESLLYMILHVLISGVFAVAVHFVSRRSTGIGLLDHARELLQHPEVCLVVIGSFYMAPSFVAPGKHWNFLSFFYEIVTTRLRTEHGIGDGIPS
ncbi:hypothetical protein BC828DRAFT_382529 [Blastocladiella britannica]|nr:hypothetical protein BC828DRAFT_382529 [Blastocladiella britannica]